MGCFVLFFERFDSPPEAAPGVRLRGVFPQPRPGFSRSCRCSPPAASNETLRYWESLRINASRVPWDKLTVSVSAPGHPSSSGDVRVAPKSEPFG